MPYSNLAITKRPKSFYSYATDWRRRRLYADSPRASRFIARANGQRAGPLSNASRSRSPKYPASVKPSPGAGGSWERSHSRWATTRKLKRDIARPSQIFPITTAPPDLWHACWPRAQTSVVRQSKLKALCACYQILPSSPAGDLYKLSGRERDASTQYALIAKIARLNEINGVLYNRQLALFYADHDMKGGNSLRSGCQRI